MAFRLSKSFLAITLALPLGTVAAQSDGARSPSLSAKGERAHVERGRYLVKIAGCNDCHTPGYAASGGQVPESQWLLGDTLGWRGPWGTTYPANLRLYMQDKTEAQWVSLAKNMKTRPPMPWFALHDMSAQDLKAIYHYVRALGPAGETAPVYVPRGKEPNTPYIHFPVPAKDM